MPGQRQENRLIMRPDRFTTMLTGAVNHDGKITARTYADSGIAWSWYGLVLSGPVKGSVQVVARSAIGDDYSKPEQIVTGEPCQQISTVEPRDLPTAEQYLAALCVAAAADEIKDVTLYSQRSKTQAIPYGATFTFHSGAAIFMYITEKDHGRYT